MSSKSTEASARRMIGYGRVSTTEQNVESQHDALTKAGARKVYVDHYTGTKASRPQWDIVKEVLDEGDVLVVTRLDRLGRSTKDLLEIVEWLKEHKVDLVVTEQAGINTTTAEGKLFFTMVAAFAEFEHSMMRARTLDGLAAARARGRKGGRKAALSPKHIRDIRDRAAGGESITSLAGYFDVSRPTIYRALAATE